MTFLPDEPISRRPTLPSPAEGGPNASVLHLVEALERHGARLEVAGDRIRIAAPKGLLDSRLRTLLARRKPEILALLTSRGRPPDYAAEAAKAAKALDEQGWVAVWSSVLGEVVVWVRDQTVTVPAELAGAARYTLAELAALTEPPVPGPEELRRLHRAKRVRDEARRLFGCLAEPAEEAGGPNRADAAPAAGRGTKEEEVRTK